MQRQLKPRLGLILLLLVRDQATGVEALKPQGWLLSGRQLGVGAVPGGERGQAGLPV